MNRSRPWILVTVGLILCVAMGLRREWLSFPRFIDSYYHLAVIQGFHQAGGIPLQAFWEWAPEGRPHLYPPLFHLLWALVWRLVHHPITVARLWSLVGASGLLGAAAWATQRLGSARRACLTVAVLLMPTGVLFSTLIHPTATLAMIEVLGLWVLVERRRVAAAGLVMGLIGYTHPGIPWVALSALGLLGLGSRAHRHALVAAGLGLLVMAPWWLHVARHGAFHWVRQPEDQYLELSPIFLLCGGLGLWVALRKEPAYRFPVALLVAMLPWMALYRYRLLSAQGLVPIGLLAGLALDAGDARWRRRWGLVGVGVVGALWLLNPTLATSPAPHWLWADTGLMAALRGIPRERPHVQTTYYASHMDPLAEAVRRAARPTDLMFCNYAYVGGQLSVLTGLATTTSMVYEAGQPEMAQAMTRARWLFWLKQPSTTAGAPPALDPAVPRLARERGWRLVMESPIAVVYESPEASGRRVMQGAVIPWWVAYGALGGLLGGLTVALRSPAISPRRSSRSPALPS